MPLAGHQDNLSVFQHLILQKRHRSCACLSLASYEILQLSCWGCLFVCLGLLTELCSLLKGVGYLQQHVFTSSFPSEDDAIRPSKGETLVSIGS